MEGLQLQLQTLRTALEMIMSSIVILIALICMSSSFGEGYSAICMHSFVWNMDQKFCLCHDSGHGNRDHGMMTDSCS